MEPFLKLKMKWNENVQMLPENWENTITKPLLVFKSKARTTKKKSANPLSEEKLLLVQKKSITIFVTEHHVDDYRNAFKQQKNKERETDRRQLAKWRPNA